MKDNQTDSPEGETACKVTLFRYSGKVFFLKKLAAASFPGPNVIRKCLIPKES